MVPQLASQRAQAQPSGSQCRNVANRRGGHLTTLYRHLRPTASQPHTQVGQMSDPEVARVRHLCFTCVGRSFCRTNGSSVTYAPHLLLRSNSLSPQLRNMH
eukprot:5413868-Pyramimonas_sp.AAC.2